MKIRTLHLLGLAAALAHPFGLSAQDAEPAQAAPAAEDGLAEIEAAIAAAVAAEGAPPAAGNAPATNEELDGRFQRAVEDAARLASVIDGKVISLADAMRMTLVRSPSIQLAREDMVLANAILLSSQAPFDHNLFANIEHGRQYTPLPDAQIQAQREAKANLQELLKEVKRAKKGQSDGKVTINETNRVTGKTKQRTIDISNLTGSGFDINGLPPAGPTSNDLVTAQLLAEQAAILNSLAGTPQSRMLAITSSENLRGMKNVQRDTLNLLDNAITDTLDRFKISTTARANKTTYSVGMGRLYRNGVFVSPHLDFARQGVDNSASINLDFNIPLMQGRGAVAQRAFEDAAYIDLDASKWQYRHNIATALINTITAYWNCVAAQQEYALAAGSEEIARTFAELSELRVENNDLSAGEAAQSEARYAEAIANRYAAEFNVFNARIQLALSIGMEAAEITDAPYAFGSLLEPMSMDALVRFDIGNAVRRALLIRDDQRAALQLARSGKILAEAARFDLKPRVDFFLNTTYASLDRGTQFERNFSAFSDNKVGMGVFGGLDMAWPIENRAARGNYERSLADYNQRSISAADLQRFISSNVVLSITEARMTRQQLDAQQRSADASRLALEAERARFNEGESSLLDAIQLETTYTQSLLRLLLTQRAHVVALSRTRYETGTLLDPPNGDPASVSFSVSAVGALPNFNGYPDEPVPAVPTTFDKKPQPLLNRMGVVRQKPSAAAPASSASPAPVVAAAPPSATPAPAAPPEPRQKPKPLLQRGGN